MTLQSLKKTVNLRKKILGKSEAREQFLPLIKAVVEGAGPINISDHGKPVAVLLSKQDYDWMLARTQNESETHNKLRRKNSLKGSIILLGDLEEGSREIARDIQQSIKRSAREL
jgi:prevent-host-death family protein